jgi:hypothetical protein
MTTKKVSLRQMAEDLGYVKKFGKYWEYDYFSMWDNYGEGPCGTAMGSDYNNTPITAEQMKEEWIKEYGNEAQTT